MGKVEMGWLCWGKPFGYLTYGLAMVESLRLQLKKGIKGSVGLEFVCVGEKEAAGTTRLD